MDRNAKTKVMLTVFVGLHIPLTIVALYAVTYKIDGLVPLLGTALASTLLAVAITLRLLHRMLPVREMVAAE